MKTFKKGQNLSTRSICNHSCIFKATVIRTTAKTVWILMDGKEKRLKIHQRDGEEFIFPLGQYSMAPTMSPDE